MREVNSLNHTRWECKYHIVFIPKYRRKVLFGQVCKEMGEVFHRLARQKESVIEEGHLMPDNCARHPAPTTPGVPDTGPGDGQWCG